MSLVTTILQHRNESQEPGGRGLMHVEFSTSIDFVYAFESNEFERWWVGYRVQVQAE